MKKTYKYRIFPSKANVSKLNRTLELCRFVYNQTLTERILQYRNNNVTMSRIDCIYWMGEHKDEIPELKQIHSQVLQNVQERLDSAYQHFFRRAKERCKKVGFPRYQGEGRYNSFIYPQSGWKFDEDFTHVYLSKIGWIKCKVHRQLEGKVKRCTVTKSPTGKWYICIVCEVEATPLPKTDKHSGFDIGISSFVTDSDGNKIDYPRHYQRAEKCLKKLQHRHSKKKTKKTRKALAKLHEKINNKRKDFLHKTSRKLIDENQTLVFEDIDTQALMQKHWVSKQIADAGWASFIQMISYKAEWAGRNVIFVNPAYTSQTCSNCGNVVPKKLSDRVHKCGCGLELDRDHNAAINILGLGMQSLEDALAST